VDNSPSKSQLKRESQAIQETAAELVDMPQDLLQQFEFPKDVEIAIGEARRLKSQDSRNRQIRYIGKLIRQLDFVDIQHKIHELDYHSRNYKHRFAKLAAWRDRIINQGNTGIDALIEIYPHADRQKLRNLWRQANREKELGKTPTADRKIFEYLKWLSD
jgi:ribosome-associated protein